jgi:hypothetical protein
MTSKTCDLEDAMALQEAAKVSGEHSFSWLGAVGWTVFMIYLVLVVGFAWNPTPFAQGLAALGIAIACAHAALSYGSKDALVLLAICLVITFAMENIGVATLNDEPYTERAEYFSNCLKLGLRRSAE